jgi:inosine/xanthosine triphosphatase
MKLNVGSKNQVKIAAVQEAVLLYPEQFSNPEVIPVEVAIEEFGHPKSLEETIKGAMDRAKAAFGDCSYSFGIEGGLMAVPYTKTGFMEVGVCAIYDGKDFHLGLSSAFEWPKKVFDLIVNKGLDGSQAAREAGLTTHEKIGATERIISLLTKGKANRKDKTKDSVIMALTHLLNPELFESSK